MSSTENGEQVIMTENMNSLPEYHYPNGLINFLNHDCAFHNHGMHRISNQEQEFVDDIYYGTKHFVIRERPRQTGGTVLMSFIMLYLLKNRKKCLFLTHNEEMKRMLVQQIVEEFLVHECTITNPTSNTIELLDSRKKDNENFLSSCKFSSTFSRGTSYDFILAEKLFNTPDKMIRNIEEWMPALNKNGKVILNRMS